MSSVEAGSIFAQYVVLRIPAHTTFPQWVLALRVDGIKANERVAAMIQRRVLVRMLESLPVHEIVPFLEQHPASLVSKVVFTGEMLKGFLSGMYATNQLDLLKSTCVRRFQVHLPEDDLAGTEAAFAAFDNFVRHPASIVDCFAFRRLVLKLAWKMRRIVPTKLVGMSWEENFNPTNATLVFPWDVSLPTQYFGTVGEALTRLATPATPPHRIPSIPRSPPGAPLRPAAKRRRPQCEE